MGIDHEFQVLVVGGGLGGLAAARFLDDAGLDPVVVERDETLDAPPAPVELWPDAMTALSWLGVDGAVREAGTTSRTWALRDDDRVVRRLATDADAGVVTIGYGRLRALLRAGLPAGAVRTDTALAGLEDGRKGVTVEFGNGVVERFDAVVGADGVHSATRGELGGPSATVLGTTSCAFRLATPPGPDGPVERWSTDGTVLRVLPAGDGAWGWLTLPSGAPADPHAVRDAVRERLPGIEWLPPLAGVPESRLVLGDRGVETGSLAGDRVALVGDAAHARHRLAGLGPTLALEDAAALAAALSAVDGAVPARLAAYATRRRSRLGRLDRPDRFGADDTGPLPAVADRLPDAVAGAADTRGDRLSRSFSGAPLAPAVEPPFQPR